jgi:hypothetical protein
MQKQANDLSRRDFVRLASITVAGCSVVGFGEGWALGQTAKAAPLFDGKTLDGWIDIENNATLLAVDGIADPAAFARKLSSGTDAVSGWLRAKLEPLVRVDLASFSATNANARALLSATVKDINQVLAGPSIYDATRFSGVTLRPETEEMLKASPRGARLARLNKLLLEDAYPAELAKGTTAGWVVKDGAIASTGVGRGVLYTANDYGRYRLMFKMRHVSGSPDHYACVLLFGTPPQGDDVAIDALNGIQFGLPNGNHWDYRGGGSSLGDAFFTTVNKVKFDEHAWSQVEILVDAAKGTARMAVAQPIGSKAVEVVDFRDAAGGRVGPIALQMHNAGLFDEYKDLTIEVDPKEDRLITVG